MGAPSPATPFLPLLCVSLSLLTSLAQSASGLRRGASFSVEDAEAVLSSADGSFASGFRKVGTNAYCFAVWFSRARDRTLVWVANRDRPLNGRGSRVTLQRDGDFVLSDADGSVVWNTNTSYGSRGERVELSDSGNLLVRDPSGQILWQSFDFPTDTLLPLQPITKSKKLVSAKGGGAVSSGHFSFFFDNDNVLKLIYDGPEITSLYWPDPGLTIFQSGRSNYNSSRYAVLDHNGRFLSSDQLDFYASDRGPGKRRMTLDYDGNLRIYSLNESSGLWAITWVAVNEQCRVHGLCGRNGICVYRARAQCSCPVSFEMSDPSDWSQGCRRKFNLSGKAEDVKFIELPRTDFYGFDLVYQTKVSFKSCMHMCLESSDCEGFGYRIEGLGVCFGKSALFNGLQAPNFQGSIFLKVPRLFVSLGTSLINVTSPICTGKQVLMGSFGSMNSGIEGKYTYFYGFVAAVGVIEILFIGTGWWHLVREEKLPESMKEGYRAISNQFRRFTHSELKKATKNFKEELGRGSSGVVYKGVLEDDRVVAVKKLADAIHAEGEFWAEVSTIGKIYHMNLLRMWGYCSQGVHRLLVYEYIGNGSLAKHLFSNGGCRAGPTHVLPWEHRYKIAVGMAKGLSYLHHECLEWVIHCDVKPENILLDSDFEPKIADFGLAKLCQRGGSWSNFSHIRGTKGYMAPEWVMNLPITAKVDVYSYGVVLLEIVKGSRVSEWAVDGEKEEILRRFGRLVKTKMENADESWLSEAVDGRLKGKFDRKQAAMVVELGLSCVEEERSRRPTMDAVLQNLLEWEVF